MPGTRRWAAAPADPVRALPAAHGGILLLAASVDLTGWGLVDAVRSRQQLSGQLAGGGVVQVTAQGALQLGNQGDTLILVEPSGASIDQLTYKADRVRAGRTICFGR